MPVQFKYRKPESVLELQRIATEAAQKRFPNMNPKHLAPRIYRDDSANALTKCVVDYITFKGGFASRINSTGVYRVDLGKYTPGTQKKGIADVWATYKGLSIQVEIKHGRDSQNDSQRRVESEQGKAGGLYFIARNFTDFKAWFDSL